jgi:hypothetical protein
MSDLITDPNQVDSSDGLITSPDQNTGVSSYEPAPVVPINTSVAYKGPTAAGGKRAASMLGQIDQRVAGYEAKDAVNTQNEIAGYKNSIAGEKAAIGGVTAVNDDYERQLKEIDTRKQALLDEASRQEKDAAQQAKVSAADFTNKYQQQLAAVRALSVNVSGPLAKLSTAEAGGVSLAMFAQGFLAAQGISINVGGQIDNWVQRSIHEQERQINQAEQGAQDTLNLWHIARQNSADDLEARQRYRGFIIEGLKAQTDFQAARFQSRLASAQANVTKAHLDTEATLTETNMAKAHEQRVFEQKKWETTTAFELAKVNLESQKVALEAAKNANKGQKRQILIDPSDGKAKWVIGEDRINATKDAEIATEAQKNYDSAEKAIKEAINFRTNHAEDTWGHLSFVDRQNQAKRQYEAMVERLRITVGKAEFGTRASDKEAERIRSLIPFDKWYQHGDNASIWNKFREDTRSEFESTMAAHADAIPPDHQVKMPRNEANPSAHAVYQADVEGGKPVDKFAAKEQAQVVGKDSENIDDSSYGSGLWRKFTSTTNKTEFDKKQALGLTMNVGWNAKDEVKMPGWAVAIDHLATGWANPESLKALSPNEDVDTIKSDSEKTLKTLASGKTLDGKKVPPAAQEYAKHILELGIDGVSDELTNNPLGAIRDYPAPPKYK